MNSKCENGTLTVFLTGRIDSSNADAFGAEFDSIYNANPAENLVFDAAALEYISSAGLRQVLRARKMNASLNIINVSSDVYEVFDMTGFTEMIPVEKAYRQFSVEGCKIIGQGAKGTVYRYNEDTIIKVYKSLDALPAIKRERELARKAFVLGIPTAISYDVVQVDGKFGSVFELLDAKSYSQLMLDDPANRDKYIADFALLLRKIHDTPVKADDMPDIKGLVRNWVSVAAPFIPGEEAVKIAMLVEKTPDTLNMLHCDYHTNNVMLQNGETLLIDMDTLSHGHPIFELANVHISFVGFAEADPEQAQKFLDGVPADVSNEIWRKFLPTYLGTDDPARIADVEKKAALMGYVRLLRHTARRDAESEKSKKIIAMCAAHIHELLPGIDSLDF